MRTRSVARVATVLGLAVLLVMSAVPARAASILTPTDFDTLSLGSAVAGFSSIITQILGPPDEPVLAGLNGTVYQNGGVFTYALTVQPTLPTFGPDGSIVDKGVNSIEIFQTGFSILGFNGVMGYSFGQAGAANVGTGVAISDVFLQASFSDPGEDGSLAWLVSDSAANAGFWRCPVPANPDGSCPAAYDNSYKPITFFFQSTFGPGGQGIYSMINQHAGTGIANGLAPTDTPVPEPMSLLLLSTGFAGVGAVRAWRQRRSC